jgi:methionyl-tRNA formyltransferase
VPALVAEPQPAAGASYAAKIGKAEAWLDWAAAAPVLARRVRAFDPFPVALARMGETPIKIWRAEPVEHGTTAAPGTIVGIGPAGIDVACGTGCIRLTELQRPGGKRLPAREFLAGFPLAAAQRFEHEPVHD